MSRIPLLLLPLALLAAACDSGSGSSLNLDDGSDGNDGSDGSDGNDGSGAGTSEGGGAQGGGGPGIDPALADREVDYNEALRTASLKLIRRLPTLAQIKACLLYTSPSPRDRTRSRMPSSA